MAERNGITRLSAVELRQLIGRRELSPVEILDAFIARIEALNPAINAMTATCFARARKEAREAECAAQAGDALGPLHGLPFAVKDLEDTAGVLTTYGSPLFKNHVPEIAVGIGQQKRIQGSKSPGVRGRSPSTSGASNEN